MTMHDVQVYIGCAANSGAKRKWHEDDCRQSSRSERDTNMDPQDLRDYRTCKTASTQQDPASLRVKGL
jgi:hypothetical protein